LTNDEPLDAGLFDQFLVGRAEFLDLRRHAFAGGLVALFLLEFFNLLDGRFTRVLVGQSVFHAVDDGADQVVESDHRDAREAQRMTSGRVFHSSITGLAASGAASSSPLACVGSVPLAVIFSISAISGQMPSSELAAVVAM
jgi:hypothetical protein